MKHIIESIIGRKGTSGASILQQGDIIITRRGGIYMVLTDQDCLKKILNPAVFRKYNMSKGAYVHCTHSTAPTFMELSSFGSKLENINGFQDYDIVQVWRNFWNLNNIVSSDDVNQIIRIENLKLLKESYKLIWKR